MRRARQARLLLVLGAALLAGCLANPDPEHASMGEQSRPPASSETCLATFGGGCFWCVEAVFEELDGVLTVESGYAGGTVEDPSYEQVGSGESGHAEVCRIRYDPARISYEELLEVFFQTHDPTTPDRQGADVGPQYRSIVLAHDEEQLAVARSVREELDASGAFAAPIVTEISKFTSFWPAGEQHQDFYVRNASAGYCQLVIVPKLEKLRKVFGDRLKKGE